jgi:uncharacterized Tic20 family protein
MLGAGLFLPPLAWFANLEVNFALAPMACSGHAKIALLLVSLAALVIALAGCFLAWTQRSFDRRLGIGGAVLSAFLAMVIVAQAIPNLILRGCE